MPNLPSVPEDLQEQPCPVDCTKIIGKIVSQCAALRDKSFVNDIEHSLAIVSDATQGIDGYVPLESKTDGSPSLNGHKIQVQPDQYFMIMMTGADKDPKFGGIQAMNFRSNNCVYANCPLREAGLCESHIDKVNSGAWGLTLDVQADQPA